MLAPGTADPRRRLPMLPTTLTGRSWMSGAPITNAGIFISTAAAAPRMVL
jgi:hypothetical protein